MKTSLSVFFLIALSTSVAHAGRPVIGNPAAPTDLPTNGHCSSADGDLKFTAFQYQGGAGPFPGMLVASQSMVVNGFEWGFVKRFQPGSEAVDQDQWPLVVELDNSSVVLSEGSQVGGRVVYTAKLTVSHLTADVAPVTRFVICEDSWALLP